jgi:hypothetical protein
MIDLVMRAKGCRYHLPEADNNLAQEGVEIERHIGHPQTVQDSPKVATVQS